MQNKNKIHISNNIKVSPITPEPTVIITEPTRKSRNFEDNVAV